MCHFFHLCNFSFSFRHLNSEVKWKKKIFKYFNAFYSPFKFLFLSAISRLTSNQSKCLCTEEIRFRFFFMISFLLNRINENKYWHCNCIELRSDCTFSFHLIFLLFCSLHSVSSLGFIELIFTIFSLACLVRIHYWSYTDGNRRESDRNRTQKKNVSQS